MHNICLNNLLPVNVSNRFVKFKGQRSRFWKVFTVDNRNFWAKRCF